MFVFAKIFLFVSLSFSSFFCTGAEFITGPSAVASARKKIYKCIVINSIITVGFYCSLVFSI